MMTLWPRFLRARPELPLRTETWTTPDSDSVDVVRLDAAPGAPRVFLLHGLEGTVRSHYALGLLDEARRRGWGADMLLYRTCNGRTNRLPRSYHSGETTDADFAIRRIAAEHASSPLGLVGVSLGANVLLKWLGEQAAAVPTNVCAAVAVSTPFDLARSSRRINQGASRLYQRHFLRSLRSKALEKIDRFPAIASRERVLSSRTLWAFDDAFTAPVHGFRDAADYYHQASSIGYLASIRVPTLLLSSLDDPFHPPGVIEDVRREVARNPLLVPEFHSRGGHVGFTGGVVPWRPRYYAEARACRFIQSHLTLSRC